MAKQHLPETWFGIVVQQKYLAQLNLEPIANELLPEIDESLPFVAQVRAWVARYREYSVDTVVFHRFTKPDLPAALAALWLDIPHRVGGADKGIQALLTDVYTPSQREKVIDYHQNLMAAWLYLPPPTSVLAWPYIFREPLSERQAVNVLIAPFAQHSKIWPASSWHRLLRELLARSLSISLSTAPTSASDADQLLADFPEVENHSRTSASLHDLFECVQAARVIVTVDTGIRHVAAMLGVPCVVLGHGREHRRIMDAYVPTERYLWNAVPCAPCGAEPCPLGHLQCVRGISVEEVLAAIEELQPGIL